MAIYNRDQEAEFGTIKKKFSSQLGRGLKSGPSDYNSRSVTVLHYLPYIIQSSTREIRSEQNIWA